MEYFEIRLKGRLDPGWSEWFEGLAVTNEGTGQTVLHGSLPDQAALFGILLKIRDLGLQLLSVTSRPVAE
jgi:hypothetical protein